MLRPDCMVAAWPQEAFPHEPAHGFFRRLAQVNHQLSAATFADSLELNGRNIDPAEMLAFCQSLPSAHIERLVAATPRYRANLVELNGQTFSKQRDFTVRKPRVCAGCMAERAYYRNWFDLTVLNCCPIHQERLSDGAPETMAWWHPEVEPAAYLKIEPPTKEEVSWSTYVLGRMGVLPFGLAPAIDNQPLCEVITAARQIGRAKVSGWSSSVPAVEQDVATLIAVGFDVLRHGPDGLEKFFREIGRQRELSSQRDVLQFGLARRFGWIADAVARLPETPSADLVRSAMHSAGGIGGVYSRKQKGLRSAAGRTHLTLHELARQTGLKPHKVREIAIKLGLTTPRAKTDFHSFSKTSVAAFKGAFESAVSRTGAANALGISEADFDEIYKAGLVERLVRLGVPDKSGDRFLATTLTSFLASFKVHDRHPQGGAVCLSSFCAQSRKSSAEIEIAVCGGDMKLAGWDDGRVGLQGAMFLLQDHQSDVPKQIKRGAATRRRTDQPGLSFSDAAAALCVSPNSVRGLVDEGHLLLEGASGSRLRLEEKSVRRFAKMYAPGRRYAEVLDMTPQKVLADATAAGVRKLTGAGLYGSVWFERKDAARKLGWVLDTAGDPQAEKMWSTLRTHLSDVRSTNRLVAGRRGTARMRAGTGNVLFDIEASAQRLDVVVSAAAHKEPVRYDKFVRNLDVLAASMPNALFSETSGQITFRKSFRQTGAGETWMLEAARAIDELGATVRRLVRT
jgi:hypothetical protein